MADEEKQNGENGTEKKKTAAKIFSLFILLLVILVAGVFGLFTARMYLQLNRLSSELKSLPNYEHRLAGLENRLAIIEVENRLETINNSIADLSKLVDVLRQVDAEKAKGMEDALAGLQEEKELLQKQLQGYRQAQVKEPPVGDVPTLQALPAGEKAADEVPPAAPAAGPQSWWQKIVNFKIFSPGK